MKRKFKVFIPIFLMIFMMSSVFAIAFTDLNEKHWAYENVMKLVEIGSIKGYSDGTFKPSKQITRGEFFKLIMTTLYGGEDYFKINNFNTGHWASPYVIEAAMNDYLMFGTSVNDLDLPMSRLEMANVLAKICTNNNIKNKEPNKDINFSDISNLDERNQIYINFVAAQGLINGYEENGEVKFKPENNMTRAEIATVISRFLDLMR